MIRMLWGYDDAVAQYMSAHFPAMEGLYKPHISLALVNDDDVLVGAIALRLINKHDGSISMVIDDWRAFPGREKLRELFALIFSGRKPLTRLSANVARGDKRTRRLVEHLGFKLEGVKRLGYDGRQHACMYGMLAAECPWIEGPVDGSARSA